MVLDLDELGRPQSDPVKEQVSASGLVCRIRDVEPLVLHGKFPFVLVHTEEGLTGVGECDTFSAKMVKPVVDLVLRPLLVGRNALDVGPLWDEMGEATRRLSMSGGGAMSAVDIALWDIAGKALGVPVHRLLGGKRRDRVKFYASSMRHDLSVEDEVKRVVEMIERGFDAYKLHGAVRGFTDHPGDHSVATIRAIRKEVGDELDILLDVNGSYSRHHAIEVGRQLEELRVHHFEEPVNALDYEGMAAVADALDIAVAAGERCYNRWQLYDLARYGRVDILQPTITRVGGFTELRRIDALASVLRLPLTVNNVQPTVATVAHLHFLASSTNVPYAQEYNVEHISLRDDTPILREPLHLERGGFIRVPDGPGLGIEVDIPLMRRLAEGI
ncbi:MAG TPA: mandelate racemase/muconate lactonizing enzyme family protein [Chloroflexota bacterium]|nr:mandelate racemase/muconate lactonizing enzyme family protein [Chloroflexota bacterium]